jgi:hypothetical protein
MKKGQPPPSNVDEGEGVPPPSVQEEGEATSTKLSELEGNDPSLRALLKVLLDVKTLPHVVLIFILSTLFYVMSTRGAEGLSALGFLSLTGGYLVLGLLSKYERIDRMTRLPEQSESLDVGRIKRFFFSFRICLLPLAFSLGWLLMLLAVLGGDGIGDSILESLPFVMGSLFVFWAVMQGRSFGHWLSSVAALRLPDDGPREGGMNLVVGVHLLLLTFLSVLILSGVEFLQGDGNGLVQDTIENGLFFLGFGGLFVGSTFLTWNLRTLASRHRSLHRFSSRWFLLTQALITWHFLTVWRHTAMSSGGPIMLIEELVLMVSTVFMAIWGLTSRSYKSKFRLVDEHNALPIGLAFGYAYAGSVAMLTNVLDDIRYVMISGHVVVILTFIWMQRKVLRSVLADHDSTVGILRTVREVTISGDSDGGHDEEHQVVDTGSGDAVGEGEPSEDATGIAVDEEWAKNNAKDIGGDVSWNSEDIIELMDD